MCSPRLLRVAPVVPLLFAACVVGVDESAPPDEPQPQPDVPVLDSLASGAFHALSPFEDMAGTAQIVRRLDGVTELSIALSGVMPATQYTAHLHNAPCQYQGGGHYKIDPAIATTVEANELWVRGSSTPRGSVRAHGVFPHLARGEALSIVVHDPTGGAKMACADLVSDDIGMVELAGTLAPLATATGADLKIVGTIAADRTSTSTAFRLTLTGLDPAAVGYGTHVHAEPCTVGDGGGHYKKDPTVAATIEANEIWIPVTADAAGTSRSTLEVAHAARTDAQSIVVHRTITAVEKPKVACGTLLRTTRHRPLETTGTAIALASGDAPSLTGTAIMTRKLTGVTEVAVVVAGLTPSTSHEARVHAEPCSMGGGGDDFEQDGEQLAFELAANANGAAGNSGWLLGVAHAAAQSLVVHAADDTRLACFDLR